MGMKAEEVLALSKAFTKKQIEQSGQSGAKNGNKTLWRGVLLPGGEVRFNVPEECYHNFGTILTLVIESYKRKGAGLGDDPGTRVFMVPLCYGTVEDFGFGPSAEENPDAYLYAPKLKDNLYPFARIYEQPSSNSQVLSGKVTLEIKLSRTADVRGSQCVVQCSYGDAYCTDTVITCISAYVPEEWT